METETLLQDHQSPGTQDQLNPEVTKEEDLARLQVHQIVASEQDQVLDTVRTHLSVRHVTTAVSAPIAQLAISAAIHFAGRETHQGILESHTSHVQTQESMTATATLTAKTEYLETSHAIRLLLALATRTQIVKHSLKTRF
jgi:3-dehydroquinate dehydratase